MSAVTTFDPVLPPSASQPLRSFSKSSAPATASFNPLGQSQSAGWNLNLQNHNAASVVYLEGSPRPLPVPESFGSEQKDEDWRRRKNRRRTIEADMAKLKDENVVERKRCVLFLLLLFL